MSYLDNGFDENLQRIDPLDNTQQLKSLDPQQFDNLTDQISGSKIQGGLVTSPDQKISLDLEQGSIKVNNGVETLVQLGTLPDGKIGLLIKDNKGNILMQISSDLNIIQTGSKNVLFDLDNEFILISENGVGRVLIGKDEGAF